jgi:hypothetical protein
MNLKQILNNVLEQSGFLARGQFTDSSDPDDKQMVAIANRAALEIMNYFMWPSLQTSFKLDIIGTQTRYKLPADFLDVMPNSAWELDGERAVEWPVPQGRWFMYKFTSISDGGRLRVRRYGDEIEVHDPETDTGFQFEYISKWPVLNDQSVRKELFTEDTDTWILDDQVLILGIQAHWMQTKLMPQYVEHFANYNRKMAESIGRESSGRTIGGFRPGGNGFGRGAPYYPLWQG